MGRVRCGRGTDRDLARERLLEQAQLLVAFDAAELLFDLEERRRAPAQLLIARAPAPDAARLRLHAGHHTLDQIRRLETRAACREYAEPMQGQRFLQAFLETARRGFVEHRELADQASSARCASP